MSSMSTTALEVKGKDATNQQADTVAANASPHAVKSPNEGCATACDGRRRRSQSYGPNHGPGRQDLSIMFQTLERPLGAIEAH